MKRILIVVLLVCAGAVGLRAQVPLSEYAARRARLLDEAQAPVVLFAYGEDSFGIGGQEALSPETTFRQEENFYYLTGLQEPDAALLLIPQTMEARAVNLPGEMLFLLPRNKPREHWMGVRMGPDDPGIEGRTGFGHVEPFAALRGELERAAKVFPDLYTLLPTPGPDAGRTHAGQWVAWLREALPNTNFEDVRGLLGALRQVKSSAEQALLRVAIERSMAAHRAAMRGLRPGMHEYEIAALMEYTYKRAGCERSGYAPIVGSGFNSTVLHYDGLKRQMEAGDVVVIDVGGECDAYTADITRTLPVSGRFSQRQREIYEIVLGAQKAAIAAVKPGMTLSRTGDNSLYRIAYDYINTHGHDRNGAPLGPYFIHGLGHHIGLQVHDAGDPKRPLEPGMIITIEPGIYIPEENLGVRIEDDVLVTPDGAELLTADLPRTVEDIERAMAEAETPQ
jgi:Xaa-Pro aminopeptidase